MSRTAPSSFGSIKVRPPLAVPGQTIGLLGGSFNPPHAGHMLISRAALRRLELDRLWWLITPGNPLKSREGLAPLAERLALSRNLAGGPRVEITAFEQQLGTPYTAATLEFLRRRFPSVRFVWVMGADNLAGFHRWQQWRKITELMPIAVVDRPGWRRKALASRAAVALRQAYVPEQAAALLGLLRPPAWTYLTGPLSRLSSTELRALAAQGPQNGPGGPTFR